MSRERSRSRVRGPDGRASEDDDSVMKDRGRRSSENDDSLMKDRGRRSSEGNNERRRRSRSRGRRDQHGDMKGETLFDCADDRRKLKENLAT